MAGADMSGDSPSLSAANANSRAVSRLPRAMALQRIAAKTSARRPSLVVVRTAGNARSAQSPTPNDEALEFASPANAATMRKASSLSAASALSSDQVTAALMLSRSATMRFRHDSS